MIKAEIRKHYKSLRKSLSQDQVEDLSLKIANLLLGLPIWDYEFYHIFLSIIEHKEVNTDYILNILSGKDKNIIISKSDFSTREMTHVLLTDNTKIKKNEWNIPEPIGGIPIATEHIEVVFIPLLAFDKTGHRVGYGEGFYDTFLSRCQSKTLKIGLSFYEEIEEISDTNEFDVTLDYCVTPDKIYDFRRK
ncbi:5-formyltetrahydrofolate cyclo-ligase [Psychroserpens sp. AS72]|uniref:5-formyltetrahydrofolate cyclo-ligase n=1 Tax=Psychroserpens sp. AS72 TaxID=3135775 RepID=UPI003170C518